MISQGKRSDDLIKTITEDEEIQDLSEDSDQEFEYQPTREKRQKVGAFDGGFEFVSSVKQYHQDSWDDLMKYVKKKNRTRVDDKIAEIIKNRENNDEDSDSDAEGGASKGAEDIYLSDDELQHDGLRVKDTKRRKKKRGDGAEPEDENDEDGKAVMEEALGNEEITSFYQMNLSRPLMRAIGVLGFVHPTPIQTTTIPIALLGRDICGCAATGTGKTAAYMLPTLERLIYRPANQSVTRVLVLVPTRELGAQVYQVTKQLSQFTSIEVGLAIGGLDVKAQELVLRQNPDVVIATPGRLIDHIKNTPSFSLGSIEVNMGLLFIIFKYFSSPPMMIYHPCALNSLWITFWLELRGKLTTRRITNYSSYY